MKKFIIFSLIAGFTLFFISCDKTARDYSDADAVFEKITKTFTLQDNDSVNYHYQHELKLNSYYSFNRLYGETFVIYDPNNQELVINESVTTTAEGEKVPSPDNAFNKVLPRFAAGAPPYNHLREMVITHTGLEKNSTINLDYVLKSAPNMMPFLMGNEILAESSPVRELIIKVRVPENKKLNYKLLNAEEDLNIGKKGSFTEYEWTFKNLEPVSMESNKPEFATQMPRLLFSTADLNTAYSYINKKISYNLPKTFEKQAEDIVVDSKNALDSILALQNKVVSHINHFNVPLRYSGYQLKNNEEVLEDNGGTTEEKTFLLASLVNHLGFDAAPVAIIPKEFHNEESGNLEVFEKYFVKVDIGNELLYLSAIENNHFNSKYEYPNEVNLLLKQEKPEFIQSETNNSQVHMQAELELNNQHNMASGTVHLTRTHCENPFLQIKRAESYLKSIIRPGFSAGSVTNYEIKEENPAKLQVKYSIEQKLEPFEQGDYWFMEFPSIQTGIDRWGMDIMVSEREAPYQIRWPLNIKQNLKINLPENIKLISESFEVIKENETGKIELKLAHNEGQLAMTRNLKINEQFISPEKYAELKELMDLWTKPNYKKIIFNSSSE